MERFFKLKEHGTNQRTEIVAGITTFLTMAYILAVNPDILSATGMDKGSIFTATALSAGIATLVMAIYANLPYALAPGMGLNAFFAFTVCIGMGKSWEFALTAVLIEGLIFILLTIMNVREAIVNSIPDTVKKAISVGIGLFIAFIALQNAHVIVDNPATLVSIGKLNSGAAIVFFIGIIATCVLLFFRLKTALLLGIIISWLAGYVFGVSYPIGGSWFPPSISPTFFKFVPMSEILSMEMLGIVFVFLFVDMFDTVGTLIGVATKAKMLDENGKIIRVKEALMADAVGTTVGAVLGTSTVTTFVESASGVEAGGRTGLTALVTAGLFFVSLLLSPIFLAIPGAATAPALLIVGVFMLAPIKDIDLTDITEAVPAFLTLVMMPLSYSIAEGISFGVISWVLLKVLTGQYKKISLMTWFVAALFFARILFSL